MRCSLLQGDNELRQICGSILRRNEQVRSAMFNVCFQEFEQYVHPLYILDLSRQRMGIQGAREHIRLEGVPEMWRIVGGKGSKRAERFVNVASMAGIYQNQIQKMDGEIGSTHRSRAASDP